MNRQNLLRFAALSLAVIVGFRLGTGVAQQPAPPMPTPLTFPPLQGEALVLILGVVDGDTVDFAWLVKDRARLVGVNAPEVEGVQKADGLASKANLAKLVPGVPCRAVLKGREKYGRALMDFVRADGKSLSQLQIDGGFAKPWGGKGPRP